MSENTSSAGSSKGELEQLSAIEESMVSFGMGDLDSERGVILKDWSAQDFANIYVRFRPHLINHARKFLREESQAEEVVQDAFLYLMTALPELDSELGVLRFLKWKTKMLCFDILRSSQAGLNNNLVPLSDDFADEAQPIDSLERADDAAIIRLALAKLNPRHREALIATMFEERSNEEVAQQMGVGENAFRQLLFRARSSFRKALVGEAEVEGKSVAEILSVAAKKAASVGTVGMLTTFLIFFSVFGPQSDVVPQSTIIAAPDREISRPSNTNSTDPLQPEIETAPGFSYDSSASGAAQEPAPESSALAADNVLIDKSPIPTIQETRNPLDSETDALGYARVAFSETLGADVLSDISASELEVTSGRGMFEAQNDSGLSVNFALNLESENVIQYLAIEFNTDEEFWKAVPISSLAVVERSLGLTRVSYAATDFLVGDFSGKYDNVSTTDSIFSRSGLVLNVLVDEDGEVVSAKILSFPRASE